MFGAANIVKNSDKSKYVYSGYGIWFDGAVLWSFGNDFPGNFVIFSVDNSLSSCADNCKNSFLKVLGEGPTDNISSSIGTIKKKFSLTFTTAKPIFFWVCIAVVIVVICLLTERKFYKFRADNKNVNFLCRKHIWKICWCWI